MSKTLNRLLEFLQSIDVNLPPGRELVAFECKIATIGGLVKARITYHEYVHGLDPLEHTEEFFIPATDQIELLKVFDIESKSVTGIAYNPIKNITAITKYSL